MRVIAICTLGDSSDVDLSSWMVDQGWALADRQNAQDYVPHETHAKAGLRGIWASTFIPPWKWHAQRIGLKK
jgi:endonuclease YncB( thermonuclease family)